MADRLTNESAGERSHARARLCRARLTFEDNAAPSQRHTLSERNIKFARIGNEAV
jgi:hypothetical protein